MKIVGLIGGMSWEATHFYYEGINRGVAKRMGRHHSVEAVLYSVDFERILEWVEEERWERVGEEMAGIARRVEGAGAGILLLTSNAIHKVFEQVEGAVKIPVMHIADPTGEAVRGMKRVGLLGTKVTMEEPFYRKRLEERYGVEVLLPLEREREALHRMIFEELTKGRVEAGSKRELKGWIAGLGERGAEGVILGCTELNLAVRQEEVEIPLFDTAALHVEAAVDWFCSKNRF